MHTRRIEKGNDKSDLVDILSPYSADKYALEIYELSRERTNRLFFFYLFLYKKKEETNCGQDGELPTV